MNKGKIEDLKCVLGVPLTMGLPVCALYRGYRGLTMKDRGVITGFKENTQSWSVTFETKDGRVVARETKFVVTDAREIMGIHGDNNGH